MGLAASSNGGASGGSSGGGASGQTSSADIIRRCHCYSISYLSLDRRCYRHSLTFNHSSDKTAINPKQKKKRSYGFATFKKKLIGKRRHCKGSDHGRCFREYFIDCPSDILKSLLGQYEALTLLKDLSVQADLARPPAQTLGQNLGELFESESCCDIILVYQGHHRIPAHKSVLMARCPYFSRHLAFHKSEEFHIKTRNCGTVSLPVLKAVLKYLYTGNADPLTALAVNQTEAIAVLEDEFGVPNSLESDVSFLLETLSLGDLRLAFDDQMEYLCHRTIVAARSPYLARVINKKTPSSSSILEIRLDNEIIPSKFARILIHAFYMDNLDLRLIEQLGSSESDASASLETNIQDAMNLYEIGRFLEFNFLSQACEDMLMQSMTIDNVVNILDWSLNPHGSAWISRQAWQFLEEEFFNIANSKMDVLGSLNQATIVRLLESDFTQASESEVLQALIKWGEHQLNSHTLGSRKSSGSNSSGSHAKRRDICDAELKDLLSSLINKVRVSHVLPRDRTSEVLDMALQRNLFSVMPNFSSQMALSTKYSPWDPKSNNGLYVRPRLFLPYFEECKKLIQDRCAQDPEIIASNSPCVSVPDTLYMLRSRNKMDFHGSTEDLIEFQSSRVPDNEIIARMIERMRKLVNSHSVQRALCSNFNDVNEVMNLVELRVVREFNLPDTYAAVLQKARRRSLSSSDLQERRLSSKMFYQSGQKFFNEYSNSNLNGPDVTLATNAVSTLTLQSLGKNPPAEQQESPDLVIHNEMVEGATALFHHHQHELNEGGGDIWKSSQPLQLLPAPILQPQPQSTSIASHSRRRPSSHMYL